MFDGNSTSICHHTWRTDDCDSITHGPMHGMPLKPCHCHINININVDPPPMSSQLPAPSLWPLIWDINSEFIQSKSHQRSLKITSRLCSVESNRVRIEIVIPDHMASQKNPSLNSCNGFSLSPSNLSMCSLVCFLFFSWPTPSYFPVQSFSHFQNLNTVFFSPSSPMACWRPSYNIESYGGPFLTLQHGVQLHWDGHGNSLLRKQ